MASAHTNAGTLRQPGATIASMAKFKPVRPKKKAAAPPPGAVPCVVLIILGMVLVMLFLYFVMKGLNANG